MAKNALVTGATGFVGVHLVNELIRRRWNVFALLRDDSKIEKLYEFPSIVFLKENDVLFEDEGPYKNNSLSRFNDIPRFDVCYHLASYGVDFRNRNIYKTIDGNIKYTLKVLGFCNSNKTKKFIYTGSCFQYGISSKLRLNENDILNPQSYYGISKCSAESYAVLFAKNCNMNFISVRPFGLFGEREDLHRLVPGLIKASLLNKPFNMTEGNQIRDYLYIKDFINGYIELAENSCNAYEVFNLCSGIGVSIKEITELIIKISNCDKSIFLFGKIPYRDNEVMHLVGDNSKIFKSTEWKPAYTLEEGLRLTYKWYKSMFSNDLHASVKI